MNILCLCRPVIFDGDEDDIHLVGGNGWHRERWWYKLAHVCQRWRTLTLGSASYLRLCLLYTCGTPVADMLAHSPPFPLVIDYRDESCDITVDDEEGILLALEQRDRVRRIRLCTPAPKLQKIITAIDGEYPVLEYLIVVPFTDDRSATLMFPETLRAPHLRHLLLEGCALPIGSRLLTTAMNLVTLVLSVGHISIYVQPNVLPQWVSSMPRLETLVILFTFLVPNHDVERQLTDTPITAHVALPNLRWLEFQGVSTYMEAVVGRITAPRLEKLIIRFFKQLTFSVPRLLQVMHTTENIKFDSVLFQFSSRQVHVGFFLRGEAAGTYSLTIYVDCWQLDWQVPSVAQIFNSPGQIFSTVEHLALEHEVNSQSDEPNEVDRTEWRKLLRSFSNVKTLRVDDGLVKELSRSLRVDDGEPPLELLPELQELTYSGSDDADGAFKSFVDARQNAGRPVVLIRRD